MTSNEFKGWLESMNFIGYGGQKLAAKALGISAATIRNYESGSTEIPQSVDLACAAIAKGIKPLSQQDTDSKEELIEKIARAICATAGEIPTGKITDPRSGASIENWLKYRGYAQAALAAIGRQD